MRSTQLLILTATLLALLGLPAGSQAATGSGYTGLEVNGSGSITHPSLIIVVCAK